MFSNELQHPFVFHVLTPASQVLVTVIFWIKQWDINDHAN